MRIVHLEEFLRLPENTLYAKFTPCVFGALAIKGESLEFDFITTPALAESIKCDGSNEFADLLFRAEELGMSLEMDFDDSQRDGCYERGQMFAVFERKDVMSLIERLGRCIGKEPK